MRINSRQRTAKLQSAWVAMPVVNIAVRGTLTTDSKRHAADITEATGLTPRATRTRVARLMGRGLVRDIGTGPQDPKRRFFRAEKGPACR